MPLVASAHFTEHRDKKQKIKKEREREREGERGETCKFPVLTGSYIRAYAINKLNKVRKDRKREKERKSERKEERRGGKARERNAPERRREHVRVGNDAGESMRRQCILRAGTSRASAAPSIREAVNGRT